MSNTYVAVTKPTTLTTVSKTNYGDPVVDAIDYLAASKPNTRVYNSANLSIANNTATALTFDSERYDKGAGSHSTASNTSRLTVPTSCGGVYLIGGHVAFAANATGVREVYIRLNATTTIAFTGAPSVTAADLALYSVTTAYNLAAADYVELFVLQTSGAALNVNATAAYSPEFWWIWQST